MTDEMVERATAALIDMTGMDSEEAGGMAFEMLKAALSVAPKLVLAPAEPQPDAPTDIALLPDYWDERRRRQGKPDLSRCAAELRIALRAKATR